LLCRNKSISDGVNRSETREVLSFVGSECSWLDAEDFGKFIIKTKVEFLRKMTTPNTTAPQEGGLAFKKIRI
jgi:hypothetical protein